MEVIPLRAASKRTVIDIARRHRIDRGRTRDRLFFRSVGYKNDEGVTLRSERSGIEGVRRYRSRAIGRCFAGVLDSSAEGHET